MAYALVTFLVSLGDAVISYTTPVFLEDKLGSALGMGLLLASSAAAGIVFDIILGEWFGHKKLSFFLWGTMAAAILLPLSFMILPPLVPFFVLSMMIWGLYYELYMFSNFHFVHAFMDKSRHSQAWGVLSAFHSAAYMLGPVFAESLIDRESHLPFIGATILFVAALFALVVFLKVFGKKRALWEGQEPPRKKTILHEFRVWKILMQKIWPIWLFTASLIAIDATFWSVGTVFSEELRNISPYGGWLLTIYMLPSLFIGFLSALIARPLGKKRAAFIAGLGNGLTLSIAGMVDEVPLLLGLICLASVFSAMAWPEILAVFEDYVVRLGSLGSEMVSLEQSSSGIAYIIGPIIAGAMSSLVGSQKTFMVMGGFLVLTSILALIITPRKILLPQQQLSSQSA